MAELKISKFNEEFDLKLLRFIFRKSLRLIILFAILLFVGVFLYLRYTQTVYQATAIIQLNTDDKAEMILETKNVKNDDFQKKTEILTSSVFLQRVVQKLPFDLSVFVKGNVLNFELYKSSPFDIEYTIKDTSCVGQDISLRFFADGSYEASMADVGGSDLIRKAKIGTPVDFPKLKFTVFYSKRYSSYPLDDMVRNEYFFRINSTKNLAKYYQRSFSVSFVNENAKSIQLKVQDHNPAKATDFLSEVINQFQIFELEQKMESSKGILDFIDNQLGLVERDLVSTEDTLRMSNPHNLSDTANDYRDAQSKIRELQRDKAKTMIEMQRVQLFSKILAQNDTDVFAMFAAITGFESQKYLETHLTSYRQLLDKKREYLMKITENSSLIDNLNKQISMQKRLLDELSMGLISRYQAELSRTENEIRSYKATTNYLASTNNSDVNQMKRLLAVNEKFYNLLIEKKIEFSIVMAGFVSQLVVLEAPGASTAPVYPVARKIWIYSIFIFIVISILFVAIRYLLYDEIVSLSDITKNTTAPVLGVIPKYKNFIPVSQLIVDTRPRSLMAESLRAIRSNLQLIKNSDSPKVAVCTSTISGEGKTFFALNLAGIFAFSEKSVIVLDLDLRKPKIHLGFNTSNDKGMSTILNNQAEIDECIKVSNLPNLHFITAGPIPISPAELILSKRMDELIAYLKTKYSVIIIDTPPIGLLSDAMKFLRMADYPMYIVRANFSKKSFLYSIEKLKTENKIDNLLTVLNGVDPELTGVGASRGHSYGYGYGYGYDVYGYYEEETPTKGFIAKLLKKVKKLL